MAQDSFRVAANGTQVTSGASSATVAIPNDSTGNKAKRVRLLALGNCYVLPVTSAGGTVTTGGLLLNPNQDITLDVKGFTHIAYLQETAAAKITITPIEDSV